MTHLLRIVAKCRIPLTFVVMLALVLGCGPTLSKRVEAAVAPPQQPVLDCAGRVVRSTSQLAALYGCLKIAGNLHISGENLTKLQSLSRLVYVSGDFVIESNPALLNLDGLQSLKRANSLRILGNARLNNLDALLHLEQLGTLELADNAALRTTRGLSRLSRLAVLNIHDSKISSLTDLTSIRALSVLSLVNNERLISIRGLRNLKAAPLLEIRHNPLLFAGEDSFLPELRQNTHLLVTGNSSVTVQDLARLRAQLQPLASYEKESLAQRE